MSSTNPNPDPEDHIPRAFQLLEMLASYRYHDGTPTDLQDAVNQLDRLRDLIRHLLSTYTLAEFENTRLQVSINKLMKLVLVMATDTSRFHAQLIEDLQKMLPNPRLQELIFRIGREATTQRDRLDQFITENPNL